MFPRAPVISKAEAKTSTHLQIRWTTHLNALKRTSSKGNLAAADARPAALGAGEAVGSAADQESVGALPKD